MQAAEGSSLTQRYPSCRILEEKRIPNVIWFEDALALHGSDTAVFDLYILVPDASTASQTLLKAGHTDSPRVNKLANDVHTCRGGIRLEKPGGGLDSGTVLVNASEWAYDLEKRTDYGVAPLPFLQGFLESIMGRWLDISEAERAENLLWEMSLVCLIGYAYNLSGTNYDLVRGPAFTASLAPEFHELHYDLVGRYPHKAGISSFRKHEYHAMRRRQIREGVFVPQPYPVYCFPESLAEDPELTGVDVLKRREQKKKKRTSMSFVTSIFLAAYADVDCRRRSHGKSC